jgi:lysozyme family protein
MPPLGIIVGFFDRRDHDPSYHHNPRRASMTDLVALKAANATRWAQAKLLKPGSFNAVAKHLVDPSAKARYRAVEAKTGVPWFVVAVIHEREADQKWDTHLGQGDPLNEVTRHVPIGEPAFATWEGGAIDALVRCAPCAARNKDWSVGGALTLLEGYNGFGYFNGPVTTKNGVVIARYPVATFAVHLGWYRPIQVRQVSPRSRIRSQRRRPATRLRRPSDGDDGAGPHHYVYGSGAANHCLQLHPAHYLN